MRSFFSLIVTLSFLSVSSVSAFADKWDDPRNDQSQFEQGTDLPPQEGFDQMPYSRPGFQYRNYGAPMDSTWYCQAPNCHKGPPPVLPMPAPQLRIQPFPYPIQARSFCQIRPLGHGLVDLVFNGHVLLYRGYGANVQSAIWHYRRQGICLNFY